MAFDVARGLDLPRLVYLMAVAPEVLGEAVEEARRAATQLGATVWCNRIELSLTLPLLLVAGRIDLRQARHWRGWVRWNRGRLADPVLDPADPLPGAVDGLMALAGRLRHPRSTWRSARRG